MEGFDFSQAQVDPWVTLNLLEKFYVITIRFKDSQVICSMAKTDKGERAAVMIAMQSMMVAHLDKIYSVHVSELGSMTEFDKDEIRELVEDVTGMEYPS